MTADRELPLLRTLADAALDAAHVWRSDDIHSGYAIDCFDRLGELAGEWEGIYAATRPGQTPLPIADNGRAAEAVFALRTALDLLNRVRCDQWAHEIDQAAARVSLALSAIEG